MQSRSTMPGQARIFALGTFTLAAFLLVPVRLPAQNDPEQPSLEAMLAETRKVIAGKRREIADRVAAALQLFRQNNNLVPTERLAQERAALLALGAGGAGQILEVFAEEKNGRALEQLGLVLYAAFEGGLIGPDELAARLVPLLDGDEGRAEVAVMILGGLGKKELVMPIRKGLGDLTRKRVYAESLKALARLGDIDSFPRIEESLINESPVIRSAAVTAIGYFGRPADARLVIPYVEDRDEGVALDAIRALEAFKDNSAAMKALHEVLSSSNRTLLRESIRVLGRIGNKALSSSYLRRVVTADGLSLELQKQAAIALFRMGDHWGQDKLSEAYTNYIARNQKSASAHADYGDFLLEFPDWKEAMKQFDDAVSLESNNITRSDHLVKLARCQARLGRFSKAANSLEKSTLGLNWRSLRDDPDFAEMRKLKDYEACFDR